MTTINIKTHRRLASEDWAFIYTAFGTLVVLVGFLVSLLPYASPYKYLTFYLAFVVLSYGMLLTSKGPAIFANLAEKFRGALRGWREV